MAYEYDFSSAFGGTAAGGNVRLPGFFGANAPRTAANLLPGEVAFAYGYSLVQSTAADANSPDIFIDTLDKLFLDPSLPQDSNTHPMLLPEHVGVMRVLGDYGGSVYDGHIADMRLATRVPKRPIEAFTTRSGYVEVVEDDEDDSSGTRPVLACTFSDPDDKLLYVGPQALRGEMRQLLSVADAQRAEQSQNQDDVFSFEDMVSVKDILLARARTFMGRISVGLGRSRI